MLTKVKKMNNINYEPLDCEKIAILVSERITSITIYTVTDLGKYLRCTFDFDLLGDEFIATLHLKNTPRNENLIAIALEKEIREMWGRLL